MSDDVKIALARVRPPSRNRLAEAIEWLLAQPGNDLNVAHRVYTLEGGAYVATVYLSGGHVGVHGPTAEAAIINLYETVRRASGR